ncbi:MAG: methyltransferase domain-containing protein [Verrucomicrobia bacterium]|nr:methyltransferase domain-containing protein [Verrucomicrobiota bacterium]
MEIDGLAQMGYEHYYHMLNDKVRMDAYRTAIFRSVKPGDVVVDLGAGTGLLSIWAIKAGAKKVYALEKTDAVHLAKEIARANHCSDQIEFVHGNSKEIELHEKADVLISETLGSFGVDENTLEFTLDARKRFLKPKAVLIPDLIELFVAAVDVPEVYHKLDYWRHIPQINFMPAYELFSRKIMVEQVQPENLMSSASSMGSFDLRTMESPMFNAGIYLQIARAGRLHGVAGWFKTRLSDGIEIYPSPHHPMTHWKQAFFPFKETIKVIAGDVVEWKISLDSTQPHSDNTSLSYHYRCTQFANELKSNPTHKPGRNEPCPCGSGKKIKICCGVD